jgi:hypothetical protein
VIYDLCHFTRADQFSSTGKKGVFSVPLPARRK